MLQINGSRSATLNFNTFLEKAKLKDDGSNFVVQARNLRLILQAGKKNYVRDAVLGDEPPATADQDVKNIWLTRKEDYSVVQCAVFYGLEPDFNIALRVMNHMRCSKS